MRTVLPAGSDRAPRRLPAIVSRDAVVKLFLDADPADLIVVEAPAGFGKSTVLSLWDEADERPFAWVHLDRLDDDPVHLVGHVASAVDRVAPLGPELTRALSRPGLSAEELVGTLLSGLGDLEPMVLVLDDVHALAPDGTRCLDLLVGALPAAVQPVLAGRSLDGIPLARRRMAGSLTEIGAADLSMTDDEARSLFDHLGAGLTSDEVAQLVDRTEGWVGGLRLAALAMERGGRAWFPDALTGSHLLVADYLVEEVLDALPDEDVGFLERSSLLDRMDGELLDEVLEDNGSAERLHQLERTLSALLVALDDERRWYRFHHLFGELLHDRLRARDPEGCRRLEVRASSVLEARGDLDGALLHAVRAHDVDRAADLVQRHAAALVLSGRGARLARWLDLVGPEQVDGDVRLALAAAWLAVWQPDVHDLRTAIVNVERFPVRRQLPDGSADSDVAIAVIRALGATRGLDGVIRDCEYVRSAGGPAVNPWWSIATAMEASARSMRGEVDVARALIVEVVPHLVTNPGFRAAGLAHLALLELAEGDVEAAVQLSREGVELADDHDLRAFAPAMIAYAVGSLTTALEGDVARSNELAAVAAQLIDRLGQSARRTALIGHVTLARAALARGEREEARQRVVRAERVRRDEPAATALNEQLERLHEALDVPGGGPESLLTPAEQRVLPLLTTHLSLKEIADELVISRNTVKTHSVAIYRKLGVSSRSEAVAEARRRALITDEPRD